MDAEKDVEMKRRETRLRCLATMRSVVLSQQCCLHISYSRIFKNI